MALAGPGNAVEYFSENFDGYGTIGNVISAGWAVQNTLAIFNAEGGTQGGGANGGLLAENADWDLATGSGRPNPPRRDGATSSGNKIISDSDASPNDDLGDYLSGYAITTPAFSCASASQVFLHMSLDAVLNDNGGTVFEIYLHDGTAWQMVFERVAAGRGTAGPGADHFPTTSNADGFYGVLDLNLTTQAAGKSQVKLRFVNRGNSDDWWVQIDDIVIDDKNVGVAGTTGLFGPEGFAGAAGSIPVGWIRQTANGDNPWQVGDLARHQSVAGIGNSGGRGINRLDTTYALLDSDKDPDSSPDDEYLVTPTVNCSAFNQIILHFDSENVNSGVSNRVEMSADNGGSWSTVWTYDQRGVNAEDPSFNHHVVPLPGAGNASQVKVRFIFQGNDNWYWAIDNVELRGRNGDAPPAPPTVTNAAASIPLQDAFALNGIGGFNTSAFSAPGAEVHGRTDWQVILSGGDFNSPLLTGSVSTGTLTQFSVSGITYPGVYQVRARHVTQVDEIPGAYGAPLSFTVTGLQDSLEIFCENFDTLAGSLQTAVDELNPGGCAGGIDSATKLGWTHTSPAGWTIDNSLMNPNNISAGGVEEWFGWSFTNVDFWDDAGGGQNRADFTLGGTGVIAVADSDEWDDCAGGIQYNSTLVTPAIPFAAHRDLYVYFNSHFLSESPQVAEVSYSINGDPDVVILHYDADGTGDNPGGGHVPNSGVLLEVPQASTPSSLVLKFFCGNADNNWYWAIDNICVYEQVPLPRSSVGDWNLYE
jgi:hypothetical protein